MAHPARPLLRRAGVAATAAVCAVGAIGAVVTTSMSAEAVTRGRGAFDVPA